MKQPYEECPNFEKCSCNVCPLDPDINQRISYPDEEKCKANGATRIKIGSKYMDILPYQGLTKKVFNAKKAWHGVEYGKAPLVLETGDKS